MRFKYIEHKKYTAPLTARRKVDGKWSYTKLAKRLRGFRQRVWNRIASMSIASRYAPHASEIYKTYVDHDLLVTKLLTKGEVKPSTMAKRKFFVHRPKAADNKAKNRARRHSQDLVLGAKTPGRKPEPAIRINAAQIRANQKLFGGMDVRAVRSITRDKRPGRNYSDVRNSGYGARECARRRRQMAKAAA